MFFEPTIEDVEACAERLDLDISSPDADRKIAQEFLNYSNQADRITSDDIDDITDVVAYLLAERNDQT
ncbi:TPA: c1 repressor inactivator [Klebsiella aerogenes]|uniref:c1 repressor inactivator n=1 Tax=Klebsiella aerogenes TaxID=548 RepID=UPI0027F9A180|nr:c1 repressor inactivator [Klebsiella aerogenes]HDT4319341.1 c1 repressor inactivator [Klebsiella aerogenes]HDT5519359.1 c1 repressor inactivator [Klebsiella aerogenes]